MRRARGSGGEARSRGPRRYMDMDMESVPGRTVTDARPAPWRTSPTPHVHVLVGLHPRGHLVFGVLAPPDAARTRSASRSAGSIEFDLAAPKQHMPSAHTTRTRRHRRTEQHRLWNTPSERHRHRRARRSPAGLWSTSARLTPWIRRSVPGLATSCLHTLPRVGWAIHRGSAAF